jgi:hypothetical protein
VRTLLSMTGFCLPAVSRHYCRVPSPGHREAGLYQGGGIALKGSSPSGGLVAPRFPCASTWQPADQESARAAEDVIIWALLQVLEHLAQEVAHAEPARRSSLV